jgi:glyoxylase-like metal-dependent hydrolase (beta-lactamase superfamily II)
VEGNPLTRQVKISIFNAGYCTCPEHFAIRGGKWRNIRFPAMFALLEHPSLGPMLFDTGYSFQFFKETRSFPNRFYRMMTPVTLLEEQLAVCQLKECSIRPQDIQRIFISHFHADHISGLNEFPRAKFTYLAHAYESICNLKGLRALSHAFIPGLIPADFSERSNPISEKDVCSLPSELAPFKFGYDLFGDESVFAVELPGHAVGQLGLVCRDTNGSIYFFIADAAWLSRSINTDQSPDAAANWLFSEPECYINTLHQLHILHQNNPDIHIIPSHCAETLAAHLLEKKGL